VNRDYPDLPAMWRQQRAIKPPPRTTAVQPPRTRVCGRDCHTSERRQARIAAACCACVIAFIAVVVLVFHPGGAPPLNTQTPGGGAGTGQFYPHSPAFGAAVIAGEARGAAHVARGVARLGFRGAVLGRRGGFYMPGTGGFHGYGLGGFFGL
jgi:hypothetical protein